MNCHLPFWPWMNLWTSCPCVDCIHPVHTAMLAAQDAQRSCRDAVLLSANAITHLQRDTSIVSGVHCYLFCSFNSCMHAVPAAVLATLAARCCHACHNDDVTTCECDHPLATGSARGLRHFVSSLTPLLCFHAMLTAALATLAVRCCRCVCTHCRGRSREANCCVLLSRCVNAVGDSRTRKT